MKHCIQRLLWWLLQKLGDPQAKEQADARQAIIDIDEAERRLDSLRVRVMILDAERRALTRERQGE